MADGVIGEDEGKQLLTNLVGISTELAPIAKEINGKLEMMYLSPERQKELNEQLGSIGTYLEGVVGGITTSAATATGVMGGLTNIIGGKPGTDYKPMAGFGVPGGSKLTLPVASVNAGEALTNLGLVFSNEAKEGSGMYSYRIGIQGLIGELELMIQRTKDALALLSGGAGTIPTPPGGASGLDMIVPPGYPNDSYPIRVQSGEHVKVTPAGSTGGMTTGYSAGRSRRKGAGSGINVNGSLTINLQGVVDSDSMLESLRDALGAY